MNSDDFLFTQNEGDVGSESDPLRAGLVFFIGHRPGDNPALDITQLAVDDIPVWPLKKVELPGKQGVGFSIGAYDPERRLKLQWGLRTGVLSQKQEVLLGVYWNSLSRRKPLRTLQIDTFQSFEGTESIPTAVPPKFGP
jgi:hypothetical protein